METKRHKEVEMKALYANWHQSGMSKKAFCQQSGIAPATFFYWAKKFRSREIAPQAAFVALDFPSQPSNAVFMEIEYPSGTRLKFYKQAEACWIKSLL